MRPSFSFACPRCSFVVHGKWASAGWPGSCGRSFSSIGSGPIACRKSEGNAVGSGSAGSRAYRLIAPGSEWRLHREWFGNSAMADLLGVDFGLEEHKLYARHDLLLAHKEALFSHLVGRWRDLFNADFDVLLYD